MVGGALEIYLKAPVYFLFSFGYHISEMNASIIILILKRLEMEGTYLNAVKTLFGKLITNIMQNLKKMGSISTKTENKTRVHTLLLC